MTTSSTWGASKFESIPRQHRGECDAIVHMVRCFENDDVIHVDASIDPVRDVESSNWNWRWRFAAGREAHGARR